MRLFWERGYEGTSMNDLAAATGMAKPGLYATFGDKEALYRKALSVYFHELGAPLVEDLARSPDPIAVVIRRFLETVAESVRGKHCPSGCFVANSVVECLGERPSLQDMARDYDAKRRAIFVKRFKQAQKNGELPAEADATALAEFFSGQALALAVMGRAGASRKSLQRFIDTAMTVLPARVPANRLPS